jgi:hypothetical protein
MKRCSSAEAAAEKVTDIFRFRKLRTDVSKTKVYNVASWRKLAVKKYVPLMEKTQRNFLSVSISMFRGA